MQSLSVEVSHWAFSYCISESYASTPFFVLVSFIIIYRVSPQKNLSREVKVAQSCPTLQPQRLQPTRLLCPWDSPGKNTGVGCHFLLQGIFLTQGLNPGLLQCRQILYRLSHQGTSDSSSIPPSLCPLTPSVIHFIL